MWPCSPTTRRWGADTGSTLNSIAFHGGKMMAIARDERSDRSNWIAGKHITYFEEPDIIYMKFGGAVTTEDSFELLRRQLAMAEDRKLLFFVIDAEDLDNIAPEGRKA